MWTDNETDQDFINFGSVAKTVAQIVEQAKDRPVSIGISGAWGVGKSSMIKLVRKELDDIEKARSGSGKDEKYVFVEFNAWLYQGYDDARAALIEVIATTLLDEAEKRKTGFGKARELMERVNWFRAIKVSATSLAALAFGLPPVGLLKEVADTVSAVTDGNISQDDVDAVETTVHKTSEKASGLMLPPKEKTPPKQIEALRRSFEETLQELGITLVVLIDDLDRCLPETTISTLEAIRLLLFLKHTAFVIAADDQMIKHAVKRHFKGVEDDLVTNYFDKLIQVPIRVPRLGTQEVRAYMMLLYIENSDIDDKDKNNLRERICSQLTKTWQGKRVDVKFVKDIKGDLPDALISQLSTADRLAPIMTGANGISGNPRLIKRFLNALSIRMAMAKSQGVTVDEAVLSKILLFERCGDSKAYAEISKAVTESNDGKPSFLSEWEEKLSKGQDLKLEPQWNDPFTLDWLKLSPSLGDQDLRGALYVSREHAPLITPEDRLSAEAAELLQALLEHPDMAASMNDKLRLIQKAELSVIMDRLLSKANQEQEWGTPPILDACMLIASSDSHQAQRLSVFLKERPASQIKPSIIPKIDGEDWSKTILSSWANNDEITQPVKKAIAARRKNGNVPI